MKIGYFSDLHTEFMRPDILVKNKDKATGRETFGRELADAYVDADVIVAAGDIGTGGNAIAFLQDTFQDKPVIYVPGNHDHWGGEYYANIRKMRDAAEGTNVHFFYDGGTIEIDGVVFCAATLWTDFAVLDNQEKSLKDGHYVMNDYPNISILDRRAYFVRESMHEAVATMNDYRKIRIRKLGARLLDAPRDALGNLKTEAPRRLTPQDVLGFHKTALANIKLALAQAYATYKKCVIVSHHAPSLKSQLFASEKIEDYFGQKSDPFYCSDLEYLMQGNEAPVLWIHGHTHIATEYKVGKTWVVSNPKGYSYGDDTGYECPVITEV